jgi:hypothetical protein
MNYTTAAMLVNDNIRAIMCAYDVGTDKVPATSYMFKTLDTSIKVGDLVVVPSDTRHKFTTVKVTDIDVEPDFKSPIQIKWVAAKIDLENYALIHSEEDKMIEAIKASQKLKAKQELKKDLLGLHEEAISNLSITNMGSPVAIPSPNAA